MMCRLGTASPFINSETLRGKMKKREKGKEKKAYERPRIVYEKKIEVLSVVCNSAKSGFSNCMKTMPCLQLLA